MYVGCVVGHVLLLESGGMVGVVLCAPQEALTQNLPGAPFL
jgi:hypothetical protein